MPYRLLERGDVIQRGDQSLDDDCEAWTEIPHDNFAHGGGYNPSAHKPIRRFELAEANRAFGRKVVEINSKEPIK